VINMERKHLVNKYIYIYIIEFIIELIYINVCKCMYVMIIFFFSGCFYADSKCNVKVATCSAFDGAININLCLNADNGVGGGTLFYFILFYFILFCFILLYCIVLYCIVFCSILLYFNLLYFFSIVYIFNNII
jgi:hypothetical protein